MAILKDLIVHGSSRFLNKIYASEIQTPLIEAEAGIIKKLKADDVTVVGLLDVQGQMHTNSWTNSNIATIDGSFYITPTIECASGTLSSLTINTSTPPKHSFVLTAATGSSFAVVNSLYYYDTSAHTVTWAKYSKVLITGEILVGGEWIPLGTILGQLNADGASGSISIFNGQNNKHGTSTVLTELTSTNITSAEFRNLKISLYQRSGSTTTNTDAYKYPLGIYLTALGQNGKTFLDIYGGVNALTTSYGGYANPNVRIGNLSGLPAITTAAGNFSPVGWGIYTTNGYFSGTIVSNTGVIGGWKLGANSLYNGTTGLNNNTEGIYLGTDGIRNYKDSTHFVTIQNGVINAKGVNLTGKITATSGTIGGINIINGDLDVSSIDIEDLNGASNYALKTEVTDAEKVATSYITYIDSTEGIKIHNVSDQTNYLKLNSSAISMYRNNVETLNINNNEVRIGKNNGNNVYIDSDSIDIKNGQTILATFGEMMQIGQNNKNHATINPLSFKLIDKEGNTYFHVSDLRENQNGTIEIVDTFVSSGSNPAHSTDDGGYVSTLTNYYLTFPAIDTNYTVEVSDSSGEGLAKTRSSISFTCNANEGAIITITYETNSYLVKAYTLGFRLENSKIGALSCGIGDHITASGISSYAEGYKTIASARTAHAEGWTTIASGSSSHAEGTSTTASGVSSHTEGAFTTASGQDSHAEGWTTIASGIYSHAEGRETTASGQFSHAEGYNSIASGISSHSEGGGTTASGQYSHAEGQNSVASGWLSHAEGAGTIASSHHQHVQGKYNIEDSNNRYAFIIGNGRQEPNTIVRSNAFTVDWNGSIDTEGDITASNLSINKIIVDNYNIEDTNNQYAFIVGNGTNDNNRSNAFTIDWNGSIEAAGDITANNLSINKINKIITGNYNIEDTNNQYAFIIGNGIEEDGTVTRSNALTIDWDGNINTSENIIANNLSINNKIIVGSYNIEDTNNRYAFIVGNGTSSDERSNSFTVDWNGSLTLTKPVYSGNFITCKDGNDTIKFRIGGDGGAEIGSNLTVGGNETITGDLTVGSNETVNGSLTVNGIITDSSNSYSTIKYLNVGYLTVSTRKPFSLVQKTYTRTITANSACYISQKYTSPTGYIPIGIIDWGTFNGTHADYCVMGHAYIWRGNPNLIDIYVWNQHPSASATNVVIYVNILCIANTFL